MTDANYVPLTPEERARAEKLIAAAARRAELRRTSPRPGNRVFDANGNMVKWELPAKQLKGGGTRLWDRDTQHTDPKTQAIKTAPYESWQPTPANPPVHQITSATVYAATPEGIDAAFAFHESLNLMDVAIIGASMEGPTNAFGLHKRVSDLLHRQFLRPQAIAERMPRLVGFGYMVTREGRHGK